MWVYRLTLRFLLGVAEAGFLPGMILYLTYWFPAAHRARIVGLFMAAVPLASAIGAPVSGLLVGIDDVLGFKGWQWLFILEGIPSCVLGLAVLGLLPDGPARANWLTPRERATIQVELDKDRALDSGRTHHALWPAPQIIKAMGFSNAQVGFITAVPYAVSAGAMMLWGRHSDVRGERIWHVALPAAASAVGFAGSVYLDLPVIALCCLGVATVGIYATLGPFWAMPSMFLRGTAAAGGIALINSVGNLGGFAGPYLVGWIKDRTGSYSAGMALLACGLASATVLVLMLGRLETAALRAEAARINGTGAARATPAYRRG